MKNMLQNFGSILSILFVIYSLQFRSEFSRIAYFFGKAVHRLSFCYGLLTALVLLNSFAIWCNETQFFEKWCNFARLCAWASERFFPRGATSGFFQKFF